MITTNGIESTNNFNFFHCSYRNFSPDLDASSIKSAIKEAFKRWSDVTPLTFHEVSSDELPDIEIWFTTGNHYDGSNFDGRGGILAHAFYPGPGTGGDMHFDDDENFTVKSYFGKLQERKKTIYS